MSERIRVIIGFSGDNVFGVGFVHKRDTQTKLHVYTREGPDPILNATKRLRRALKTLGWRCVVVEPGPDQTLWHYTPPPKENTNADTSPGRASGASQDPTCLTQVPG